LVSKQLCSRRIGIGENQIHSPIPVQVELGEGSAVLDRVRSAEQRNILKLRPFLSLNLSKHPISLMA
jgi:hypothetical protein